jgi:ABC-type glutathione transport system ATPase component
MAVLAALCREWLNKGSSYLLISHDLELLRQMTTRVLVMDRGELKFDGTWTDLSGSSNLLRDIGFEES